MNSQDSSTHKLDVNSNQEQRNFLNNVVEINDDSLLEIRTISQSGKVSNQFFSDSGKALDFISSKANTDNIYFGVSSRKDNSSGKKRNCHKLKALFVDIDCGQDGHKKESVFKSKQDALRHIDKMKFPRPTGVIDSGNGLHLYWILIQPITFNSNKDINQTESLLKQLSLIFGGDTAYDISRLLRVPGTFNYKTNTPKQCRILEVDYSNRYELIEITSHPLLQLNLEILKPSKSAKHNYYNLLFGNTGGFDTDDRSAIDQSLITSLVKEGFSDNNITLLFNNYPITGKYLEHNDPIKYLEHSIMNAREFIENTVTNNNTGSDVDNSEDSRYKIITDSKLFGYHMTDEEGKIHRLSNFIIEFNPRTQMVRNQETQSYYSGRIIFHDNKIYPFDKLSSALLVEQSSFAKFIAQHTGTEGVIYQPNAVIWAVKYFNRNAGVKFEREYGFAPDLDQFITGNMIITKDQVIIEETPIKNAEHLGDNILELINDPMQAGIARTAILQILGKWDKPQKIYPLLAFTFYSLLEPFMRSAYPKKFYMMILGTTGSGKTLTATWLQRFFGKMDNLTPANSTYTAINNIGSAFRNCLFVVDDYKRQNFKSEYELKQASIVLQNYADNTSRRRSNKGIGASDDHRIEGGLMLTGEDIVFTESSSIARGIIVNIDSKESMFEFVQQTNEQSKHFPAFTLQFIQYLLNKFSQEIIIKIFKISRKIIDNHYSKDTDNLDINNYDREANNFAALLTSWIILKSFLWGTDPLDKEIISNDFNEYFLDLMDANLALVRELRNDDYFETLLWNSIESGKLQLSEIDNYGRLHNTDSRSTYVGYYHIDREKNISVYLNLQNTLQELKRIDPNIQVHHSTIVKKLESEGKIQKCERNKKWNVYGCQIRGVKWVGDIPKEIFGIREDQQVTDATQITENKKEEDTFSLSADQPLDTNITKQPDHSAGNDEIRMEVIKARDTIDFQKIFDESKEENMKNNETK